VTAECLRCGEHLPDRRFATSKIDGERETICGRCFGELQRAIRRQRTKSN
jgi:hypothetical protein